MSQSILQAVKLGPGSSLTGRFSRRVRELLMPWGGDLGVVTYRVIERALPRQSEENRRAELRRRTRLRSGKLLAKDNGFIVECLIRERSDVGARLQLARMVDIPDRIGLFDDDATSIRAAEVVWHRGHQLGIRFTPELDPKNIKESDLASLARQFYAVEG
jgi:hypothetical protein